jgi:hypothetical protein
MSLYLINLSDADTLSVDSNIIAAGTLICCPIDMQTVEMSQITLYQESDTQSFSLRAWISRFQGGIAIPGNYAVPKWGGVPILVHTPSQTPPDDVFPVLVEPGLYFLNIFNLTNETNIFRFEKIDLA